MATEELLRGLQAWQHTVFAAGCAYRVAPLIDAFGNDRERWTWREAVGVLLDPDTPPVPESCEPLWQRLEIVQRDRVADHQFLEASTRALWHALHACDPDPAEAADWALMAAYAADEVFDTLLRDSQRWAGLELEAQQRSLAALRGAERPAAVRAVRQIATDLGPLIEPLATQYGLTVAGPLPPRPARRVRHAGHAPGGKAEAQPPVVLVAAADRVFRPDEAGRASFRAGDVLELSCAAVETTVVGVNDEAVVLELPWLPGYHRHFEKEEGPGNWSPFVIEPPPADLAAGDACRVAIEPQLVYAVEAYTYVARRRPETQALLVPLPVGARPRGGYGRYTNPVDPYLDPIEVVLHHRSYAFLEPGDRVVDADGVELVFHPPMLFLTPQAEAAIHDPTSWPVASVPAWPLTLTSRNGRAPTAGDVERVALATGVGCHDEELDGWEASASVHLPQEDELVPWFLRVGEWPPSYRPM